MSSPNGPDLRFEWVPLDRITSHHFQPRKQADREETIQLMLSIDALGVLHPILLRPRGDAFELISGHRRVTACRKLGWTHIPAIVREMPDEEAFQAAIQANATMLDLQLMERCESIVYAMKVLHDETPQDLAQWFGVSEEFPAVAKKLVSLQPLLRESLLQNMLNPAQAIELNRIDDLKLLSGAAARVARAGMSPAETSLFVDEVLKHRALPGGDEGEGEEGEEVPPLRLVERIYTALAEQTRVDAESLRAVLRVILQECDGSLEDFLRLGYDPAEGFYLFQHVLNVARLAVHCGKHAGIGANDVAMLAVCAVLHDVGMMRVPREVLDRVEPLSDEDRSLIRRHAEEGARLLDQGGLRDDVVLLVVRQHHERVDGSGYPRGLKGDAIHHFARILAVVDTYEALVSPRVYHLPLKPPQAVREIQELAARGALDPATVGHFVKGMSLYPPGTRVRLSTGEHGVVTRVNPTHPDRPVIRILAPEGDEAEGVRTELDLLASPKIRIES